MNIEEKVAVVVLLGMKQSIAKPVLGGVNEPTTPKHGFTLLPDETMHSILAKDLQRIDNYPRSRLSRKSTVVKAKSSRGRMKQKLISPVSVMVDTKSNQFHSSVSGVSKSMSSASYLPGLPDHFGMSDMKPLLMNVLSPKNTTSSVVDSCISYRTDPSRFTSTQELSANFCGQEIGGNSIPPFLYQQQELSPQSIVSAFLVAEIEAMSAMVVNAQQKEKESGNHGSDYITNLLLQQQLLPNGPKQPSLLPSPEQKQQQIPNGEQWTPSGPTFAQLFGYNINMAAQNNHTKLDIINAIIVNCLQQAIAPNYPA